MIASVQSAPFMPLEETVSFRGQANRSRSLAMLQIQGASKIQSFPAGQGGVPTVSIMYPEAGHEWLGKTPERRSAGSTPSPEGADRAWELLGDKARLRDAAPSGR